jgi:hypothetical protein
MPKSFQPMDFDAVIERNGHLLIFETKEHDKPIPTGQQITLQAAWRRGATIIHLSGKRPEDIDGCAIYGAREPDKSDKVGSRELKRCNAADVIFIVRQWMCFANGYAKGNYPTREEWDKELWVWDYDGKPS